MTLVDYSPDFFDMRQVGAQTSAEILSRWVCEMLEPHSVLDVGCGTGSWLAAFERNGVENIFGVDGTWVPRDRLEISADKFLETDLAEPLKIAQSFDLVVCLEVAEHLPAQHARQLIKSLVSLSPVVLFSAATPYQGGTGHVNEQWPEYWKQLFLEHRYVCVDCVRSRFWSDPLVQWWYSQNMFFFVDGRADSQLSRLQKEERLGSMGQFSVVHPRLLESKVLELSNPMNYSIRRFFKVLPRLLIRSLDWRQPRTSRQR